MFLKLTSTHVHFTYRKKKWRYSFDEIIELGLIRKKKNYFFVNLLFFLVTIVAYYCMFFTKIKDLNYIIPALIAFSILIIIRFHNSSEFDYYVVVRDCYQKEIVIKIKIEDKNCVDKQITEFSNLQFERITKKTA